MNCAMYENAREYIKEFSPILEKIYGFKIPAIKISPSARMHRSFGRIIYRGLTGQYEMKLSEYAYAAHTESKAFRNTVAHELCHVAEHLLTEKFTHGPKWEQMMHELGELPSRFATVEKKAEIDFIRKPKNKMTKYVHRCSGGCKHTVSAIKHNKILKGHVYVCNRTGTFLSSSFETVKG